MEPVIQSPLDRNAETHCAVTAYGVVVSMYDMIVDFRGDAWRFLGITRVPNGGSTGRVYVQSVSDSKIRMEFFPSVFDLTIELRSSFTS